MIQVPEVERLRLSDGRTLAYAQWGDPKGEPVIHFHGSPGSRMERYRDEGLVSALGIRFITWDRPGYGYSDPSPRATLVDRARDLEALADHLGLERLRLHAMSGGTPFALASAFALERRVCGVAVLAGLGPLDRPGALEGMSSRNIEELTVARDSPERLEAFLARKRADSALPEPELAVLSRDPELLDMLIENHGEMTRRGSSGIVADDLAFVAPWGFGLAEIAAPIRIWHGEDDPVVPIHHAEHLAACLPDAVLTRCPGEGHFDMLRRPKEVLTKLLSAGSGAGPGRFSGGESPASVSARDLRP